MYIYKSTNNVRVYLVIMPIELYTYVNYNDIVRYTYVSNKKGRVLYMKEVYIELIDNRMKQCEDLELLALIVAMLTRAGESNG